MNWSLTPSLAFALTDPTNWGQNVADAFRVQDASRAGIAGRWIVLIDDVATTGATLVACASALLSGGASGVSASTVAREA